jgi:hypothetical protein
MSYSGVRVQERLGPRSTLFARLGLAALALGSLLQIGWTVLFPALYSSLDYSARDYGLLFALTGLMTSVISAAGVGLLIAALVSRGSAGGFGGQGPGGGGSFGGGPGFGAGERPAGPPVAG